VERWLRAAGLRLVQTPADDAERWWRGRAIPWGVAGARLWGKARESFASLFRLVAVKPVVDRGA
jgi:hypothetical protein